MNWYEVIWFGYVINWYDIFCTLITILSLLIISRHYRGWLLYCIACILFIYVRLVAKQYGSIGLELFALMAGLRNFIILRRKKRS